MTATTNFSGNFLSKLKRMINPSTLKTLTGKQTKLAPVSNLISMLCYLDDTVFLLLRKHLEVNSARMIAYNPRCCSSSSVSLVWAVLISL